jgi:hypothetical protein
VKKVQTALGLAADTSVSKRIYAIRRSVQWEKPILHQLALERSGMYVTQPEIAIGCVIPFQSL